MMKRLKKARKLTATIVSFGLSLILLSGCSGSADPGNEGGEQKTPDTESVQGEKPPDDVAMGRYVEEEQNLSDRISGYQSRLCRLEDGRLLIADGIADFIASIDNGASWETDEREWKTRMAEENIYVMDIAVGKDNTTAVLYDAIRSGRTIETVDGEETELTGSAEMDGAAEAEEAGAEEADAFTWQPEVTVIKPDGTQIQADEISVTEEENYLEKIFVSDTGRVFATTYGSNIYEIKEDGSSEVYLTLEECPTLIQFQGNLMIVDGHNYDGLILYDMEKQEYIQDEILNDFVNENYKRRTSNGGSFYDLYFFPGEENVLYLAGQKGLHRHVIGGSAIEQVIDGQISSFSNPSYGIKGAVALDNSEFAVLFTEGRLVRFTYNPDIPTVPQEKIKVYSLRTNNTIRQAVTDYQTQYPEVYVEYRIGIEDGSAVTREDALKKLNTEIMAGEGPDVLIMDNLPMDSYIEKGMLLDLSPVIDGLSGDDALFENIVEAFRRDSKLYAVPCEIGIPVVVGDAAYMPGEKNLKGVADMAEKLRKDYPGKNLLDISSEKGILKMFTLVSAPYWKTVAGTVDTEAVRDYFVQTKRIYEAQMDGVSQQDIDSYTETIEWLTEVYGFDYEASGYARYGMDYMAYAQGRKQMIVGTILANYDLAAALSCAGMEGFEECRIALMDEAVFWPQTLAAVSAASVNREQAETFLYHLLGKESQSNLYNGLPVNKEAFRQIQDTDADGEEPYSTISMMDEDGIVTELSIYWLDDEQKAGSEAWMEAMRTPYIEDDLLEEIVCEEGVRYLQGTQDLETAVNAVKERAALYMAE